MTVPVTVGLKPISARHGTKADAGSVVGEPDPRSFSLDNAGRVKEGHGVAGSKLGIGCPAVAIEQGEEVLSSSGGASGCAATLPAPCSNAMLPIGSCLGFGGQSVLPCPSQVRS